jgi:hypothetical protein
MVATVEPAPPVPTPARTHGPWRDDPARYIRRVKRKYQARPYDYLSRERENLGLFHTQAQACAAILKFWRGQLAPRPKFVRPFHTRRGTVYLAFVPAPPGSGRRFVRAEGSYATAAEASAAARRTLVALYGEAAAEKLLSRRDTSKRAGKHPPR